MQMSRVYECVYAATCSENLAPLQSYTTANIQISRSASVHTKMRLITSLISLAAIISVGSGHVSLFIPPTIGEVSANENTFPCDGFDANSRTSATNWAVNGHTVQFLSTHPIATYTFSMSKLPYAGAWSTITGTWNSTGAAGWVCFQNLPGKASWGPFPVQAVFQIAQHASDGINYLVCFNLPSTSVTNDERS